MSPSSTAVLGTVELLEAILFELSTKNLLHSQRVSRKWRATIKGSLKLQEALFLESITVVKLQIPSLEQDDLQMPPSHREHSQHMDLTKPAAPSILVNPLVNLYTWFLNLSFATPWHDKSKSSWRNMYLTQPAFETITIRLLGRSSGLYYDFEHTVSNPAGVTMGQISDTANAAWSRLAEREDDDMTVMQHDNPGYLDDLSLGRDVKRLSELRGDVCKDEEISPHILVLDRATFEVKAMGIHRGKCANR